MQLQSIPIDMEYTKKLRHHFHQYPELSRCESKTRAKIMEELEQLGIPFRAVGETGVIGVLEGQEQGPCIGLRADMDALPIQEDAKNPHRSLNEGIMHACGHDFHMAMLLGAAKTLKAHQHKIKGKIKLIFQPAEEIVYGARDMLSTGELTDLDCVFGMHVWSEVPKGKIGLISGPVMAAVDMFKITVKGLSAHGATPEKGIDALMIACQIMTSLQSIVSREISPSDPAVITVGKLNGGDAINIIADEAVLEGTIRYFKRDLQNVIMEKMTKRAELIAESFGGSAQIEFTKGVPPVENDFQLVEYAKDCANKIGLTPIYTRPVTLSEDFSLLADASRGVFGFVGFGEELGECPQLLHTRTLNIDDDILEKGACMHVAFAMNHLEEYIKMHP